MNHVARKIHRHETSSSSTCATSRAGLGRTSLSLPPSFFLPPLSLCSLSLFRFLSLFLSLALSFSVSLSFSVRTTHVRAIRYDWPDPRFRTNHFIKAVLNKPAFDYTPRHLVVIVPYTSSFLRTLLSGRSASTEKNYSCRLSSPPIPSKFTPLLRFSLPLASQCAILLLRTRFPRVRNHRGSSLVNHVSLLSKHLFERELSFATTADARHSSTRGSFKLKITRLQRKKTGSVPTSEHGR